MASSEVTHLQQHQQQSRGPSNHFTASRLLANQKRDQDLQHTSLYHGRLRRNSPAGLAASSNQSSSQSPASSQPTNMMQHRQTYREQMMATPGEHHGFTSSNKNKNSTNSTNSTNNNNKQDQGQELQHQKMTNKTQVEQEDSESDSTSINSDQMGGTSTAGDQNAANSKSHVGPMGIFFKVWSLVKVTKSRHQRMKRQNSEAAGQFQYNAADQFGSGGSPATGTSQTRSSASSSTLVAGQQQASQRQLHHPHVAFQRHILQDGHFRRAGSQPPPSNHLAGASEGRHFQLMQPPAVQHLHNQLQPASGQNTSTTLSAGGQLQKSAQGSTGTNSSSSGVSSTASSTLTTNCAPESLTGQQRLLNGGRNNGRSWASRMKRSSADPAPAPNGLKSVSPAPSTTSGSYVSRYRFRRADPDQRQLTGGSSAQQAVASAHKSSPNVSPNAQPGGVEPQQSKRQARAQSEVSNQLGELRRKAIAVAKSSSPAALIGAGSRPRMSLQRLRRRLRHDSVSDEGEEGEDDDDEEEAEAEADEEPAHVELAGKEEEEEEDEEGSSAMKRRLASQAEDEDSDLNEIYSTPNDSIQSVPSGQLLELGRRQSSGQAASVASHNNINNSQPQRTKMSSILLAKSAESPPVIESSTRDGRPTRNNDMTSVQRLTNQVPKSHSTQNFGQKLDVKTSSASRQTIDDSKTTKANGTSRPPHGSRFFISSSSSEDSNPPPQVASNSINQVTSDNGLQHSANGQSTQRQTSGTYRQQQQIPLQFGLHYHTPLPAPTRPDSLVMGQCNGNNGRQQQQQQQQQQPSLLTPSTIIMNGQLESAAAVQLINSNLPAAGYKRSPSLFEMSTLNANSPARMGLVQKFSSKYPLGARGLAGPSIAANNRHHQQAMSSFVGGQPRPLTARNGIVNSSRGPETRGFKVPNSISLYDCKLAQQAKENNLQVELQAGDLANNNAAAAASSEYRLARMLLELGSNPSAKDEDGNTALMHAIISDNLAAFKCLIEHGVNLDETNRRGLSAADLVCGKPADDIPLEMLKLLIDNRVDLDLARREDGSRLLDRLIGEHQPALDNDKLPFIDCLLHNGAKLGSSTWAAAFGKHEVQLRLLRKLCQDGYFLYKKSSIEAAVFRFEYALKRIAELEQELLNSLLAGKSSMLGRHHLGAGLERLEHLDLDTNHEHQVTIRETQQVKYQTFLGLSRCERKRRFFKRALEFAHMSILIDSTSYEGYYSKAHILKDIGETTEAMAAIDQTERLVNKSMETIKGELAELENQEESIVFDGCFNMHYPNRSGWIEAARVELSQNLDYLEEAKRHIARLRSEIADDEKKLQEKQQQSELNGGDDKTSEQLSKREVSI